MTELAPVADADGAASIGFGLCWAQAAVGDGLLILAAPENVFAEQGFFHPPGLAQLGINLERALLVRTRSQEDALWAAEQALAAPNAFVLCFVTPAKRALSLTATRRLLLLAERRRTRCALLRLDRAGASAAWTRWRVACAPSSGEARELGPPAFNVQLARNRAGPSGLSFTLQWSPHERAFKPLHGDLAAASADGSVDARRPRAA